MNSKKGNNTMNTKLNSILTWAQYHGIDLDRAQLRLEPSRSWDDHKFDLHVTFNHTEESADQFRAVKRAIGGAFDGPENPGTDRAELIKCVTLPTGLVLRVKWDGAYNCEVSYKCTYKGFDNDQDEEEIPL